MLCYAYGYYPACRRVEPVFYLSPYLQYEFYYHSVRKGKRFGYPPKVAEPPHLNLVTEYFQVSKVKALEILNILTEQDISDIIKVTNTGGNQ